MSHIPSRHQVLPDELFTIRFTDILHLFNLQDPSGLEALWAYSSAG